MLCTANGRIQAIASLSTGRDATKLGMQTSNVFVHPCFISATRAHLTGILATLSPPLSLSPPQKAQGVASLSRRAPPTVVSLSTIRTPLKVHARDTSNVAASVAMHPAFEGIYEVSTSNARPVVRDTHSVDPTGRGRRVGCVGRLTDVSVSYDTLGE